MSTLGAGLGPAGVFVAGQGYETPIAETRGQLVSSRLIDSRGRVVQVTDGTGACEGMNDTCQRVYLLVMSVERLPKRGPGFAGQYEQSLRDVLRPLTEGKSPAMKIVSIDIPTSGDLFTPRIVFRDLVDGGKVKVFPAT